ncbi:DUF1254 domain-containing protein [Kaistia terrae]|uniref:DUF1254 domain-containing protein n=1 Tax=Kaistia terrae TaxID=537017 RepID=A0ABW0PW70_9HYPH|nr:DUF1254 domain-containing protein [Kaistia terrae]MCX5577000.1 DUF1254 domain-containing protein [Kaistia terrae]
MRVSILAATLGAALAAAVPLSAQADTALTKEQAQAIGTDAYLYFYPLITMDLTRLQSTNIEPGKELGRGPMNTFVNVPEFPPADFKVVVRPNFDTLYSVAWLDMTEEPVVVSNASTDGRYFLLPMLDMWSDVFASPGWRTTGTQAANYLVTPPGWRPDLREDWLTEFKLPKDTIRLEAPTPYVWLVGRTKTDGPSDYDAVHKIQAGYKVVPLSQWGKAATAAAVKIDPKIDMKTPPKLTADHMPGDQYFAYAAELLKLHPPHMTDQPMVANLAKIGIVPGQTFDFSKLSPDVQAALMAAPAAGQKLMTWKVKTLAQIANGWSMNTDTMGVYGNYYLKRAIVAQLGLGANLPEDAIYPLNLGDSTGKPLDGANDYVLHFEAGQQPPVDAFWSVTLYDPDGFQVANPLNRFAVSSWMPFVKNPDGSLDLYFQNESPGKDKEANWLPAPKGPFNLTMRLYAPQSAALTGRWVPPAVTRAEATSALPQ